MASILALSTGRLYPPEGDIPRTPFYCSPCRFQGQCQLEGLSGGNLKDTIGNRTRYMPAYGAVPQQTGLPLFYQNVIVIY